MVDHVEVPDPRRRGGGDAGPNGAGKTTTFYMLVGLLKPDEGRILLDGEDIGSLPLYQRARRGISYLPQEPSVFRKLTVEDKSDGGAGDPAPDQEDAHGRLQSLLSELDIAHLAKAWRGCSRAASGGGLRLRGRWCSIRPSYAWTSRLRESIPLP